MIRLSVPDIDDQDLQVIKQTVETGFLIQGPLVQKFEETFKQRTHSLFASALTNCTAALQIGLLSKGIIPGDKVLVTSYSWLSTANAIELCGAIPIFVDIDPRTFNLCPKDLERVISNERGSLKKIKAILPVHTFGLMADMPSILEIAQNNNLFVIEDAACALGSTLNGKHAGSWADIGCFSFHPRKAITTGEGGMIVCDDPEIDRNVKALRNHGMDPNSAQPQFILPGFNCRMTEFQGAFGISQLTKFDGILEKRKTLAKRYKDIIRQLDLPLQTPSEIEGFQHSYQSYVVLLPKKINAYKRSDLIKKMREDGVEVQIGTYHMPLTHYFKNKYNFKEGDFPNTDDVYARTLSLPLFSSLTIEQQEKVIVTLKLNLEKI
jgi:perosamine synthetase